MRISYLISEAILPSMLFGFAAYLVYGILLSTCFARLRRLHPDVWNALNQPTASKGNGPVVWAARKYLTSEDAALSATMCCIGERSSRTYRES